MSTHSYSRCWLHLIWETLRREPMLDKRAAVKASANLSEYSYEKGIYMKINYVNPEHTHALIDLPTNLTIEDVIKLLKGSSSHWINEQRLSEVDSPGEEDTELFRCRTQMSTESLITSRVRKNITESVPLPKSMSCSLDATAWNGATRKTVETVQKILRVPLFTRLKPGENERRRSFVKHDHSNYCFSRFTYSHASRSSGRPSSACCHCSRSLA
jgi:REP element-mobilizing transposase RayT